MDAKEVYLKGNEAFAGCDYEQALRYFLSIFDSNPTDQNLLLRISQCYQELNLYDEAIEFLERLLNLSLEKEDFKKAVAICKRILSIDPDDTEVILKLANIFRTLKQYSEASFYYKIVARHYEYIGFMDKAVEILQIIKELGQDSIEDMLELVKKEYKRGATSNANKNIDSIISELKSGKEYNLLDVALNLALTNSPDNLNHIIELANLCFYSLRLVRCLKLCLLGMYLNPKSSILFTLLMKSLWALGYDSLAESIASFIASGEIELDDKDAKVKARKICDSIGEFEAERLKIKEEEFEAVSGTGLGVDISYLEKEDFTKVDHAQIERKIVMDEFKEKVDGRYKEKTAVIDLKRKKEFSPHVLEQVKEAEILISEGLYDKASVKLFSILKEEPGNKHVKELLDKVLKLASSTDSAKIVSVAESRIVTTDEMISELEDYLDSDPTLGESGKVEDGKIKNLIEVFSDKLKHILLPEDWRTIFDLGIAYMELELWKESTDAFQRVMEYLSDSQKDPDRLIESKIYYAYSSSRVGGAKESEKAIKFLSKMLPDIYEKHKLDVLYYLALCYEKIGDIDKARQSYKDIMDIDPSYRDVDVRTAMIGS